MSKQTEALAEQPAQQQSAERGERMLDESEQPAQQECDHCGGTGDVSGEYPGVACPECLGSGVQAQPEFIRHEVEHPYDWSEWVCPNPESYLMKCCDCGLVHEAQFGVVRYKSEAEREDCEPVDDPNLHAVFRMRRSEQWSPKDMAYRPGGLPPAEQAAQQEPVAAKHIGWDYLDNGTLVATYAVPVPERIAPKLYTSPQPAQQEPFCYHDGRNIVGKEFADHSDVFPLYTSPQPAPPPECKTDAEKTAFAFGWWKALEENRKQPAQHQEAVAWRTKNATPPGGYVLFQQYPKAVAELGGEIEPLYTSPQPTQQEPPCKTGGQCTSKCQQCEQPAQQQEPVARVINKSIVWRPRDIAGLPMGAPLYTSTQPAQPSKPLTDEFILSLHYGCSTFLKFARSIEAAHGITGDQA